MDQSGILNHRIFYHPLLRRMIKSWKDGTSLLLISKYALDCVQYNASYSDVTWENCSLRKWLNGTFMNTAFSAEERAIIPIVTVSADKNPEYNTSPGNSTQDQIFLLSIPEVNKYFTSETERQCKPTGYAETQGNVKSSNGNCWWWLRSPGNNSGVAAAVNIEGTILAHGTFVSNHFCTVRPALWINPIS